MKYAGKNLWRLVAVSLVIVVALEGCAVSVTKLGWRSPELVGTVTASSGGTEAIRCGEGCITSSAGIQSGTTLSLKVADEQGLSDFFFAGWGGDCVTFGTARECTLPVNSDRTVYAAVYPVDVSQFGSHAARVSIIGPGAVSQAYMAVAGSCPGSPTPANCFLLANGRPMTLRAQPTNTSSKFTGWDGCFAPQVARGQDCTVSLMDDDISLTATFDMPVLRIDKANVGSGDGSFTCNGGNCDRRIPINTGVTIAPVPDATSVFVGWNECPGVLAGSPATCTVVMNAERTAVAKFNGEFTLTVAKAGSLAGGVAVRTADLFEPRIDCGPGCPSQTSVFRGGATTGILVSAPLSPNPITWTGCTSIGVLNSCLVTMPTRDLTVTVTVN